jgi:hypothetical protein
VRAAIRETLLVLGTLLCVHADDGTIQHHLELVIKVKLIRRLETSRSGTCRWCLIESLFQNSKVYAHSAVNVKTVNI